MGWTMHEGYGIPIGSSSSHGAPKEVSPVSFTLHLSSFTRKQLYRRLQQAYGRGALRVVRRIQALLALADHQSVQEVAEMLNLGQQTIRDYRNAFLLKGVSSLVYTRPPGRPSPKSHVARSCRSLENPILCCPAQLEDFISRARASAARSTGACSRLDSPRREAE